MKILINPENLDINSKEIIIKKYRYVYGLILIDNREPTESLVNYVYNRYIIIRDKKVLIFVDHLFNIIICNSDAEPIWTTINNTNKLMNFYYHRSFKTNNLKDQYLKYRNSKNKENNTSFLMLTKNNIALKNLDKQIKQKKLYDILQG